MLERELHILVPERKSILNEIEKQLWIRDKAFSEGEFIIFNPDLRKPVGSISALRHTFPFGIEYRIAFSRAEGLKRFYEQFGRERIPSQYQGIDKELLFYLDQIHITTPFEAGEERRVFDKSLSTHLKYGAHPILNKEGKVRFIRWSCLADIESGSYNISMQYDQGVKITDLGELARMK